ncbi:hypothetical protein [Bifidobacterium parmae]|nr:hypothetical protein [Bifidobacterium parmae]
MSVEESKNESERADGAGGNGGRSPRDRRRATIMRGVVTPLVGLLAVAAIVVGVLNATIWQPSRIITADAKVNGSRYLVTDPNVLGLVDSTVEMNVDAGGSGDVCIAVTSSKDASGWLSGSSYTRLTGLSDWSTLSTQKASGGQDEGASGAASGDSSDAAGASADVAFKDSDMWRSVKCGKGEVAMKATSRTSTDVAIVDLGEKSGAADVSFTWTRQTLPDYATPLYFVGGLLVVLAVFTATVFAMPPHKRRKRHVESAPVEPEEEVSFGAAVAGSFGISPSYEPKSKRGGRGRRRRHAVGTDTGTMEPIKVESPVVVDPSSRNLVADAAGATGAAGAAVAPEPAATPQTNVNDEATSVISPDELQAYFARLAQEVGDGDTTAVDGTTNDTNEEDR